jgi:hypothetical protein
MAPNMPLSNSQGRLHVAGASTCSKGIVPSYMLVGTLSAAVAGEPRVRSNNFIFQCVIVYTVFLFREVYLVRVTSTNVCVALRLD